MLIGEFNMTWFELFVTITSYVPEFPFTVSSSVTTDVMSNCPLTTKDIVKARKG